MKFLFQSLNVKRNSSKSLVAKPLEFRWDNSCMAIIGTAMKRDTRVFGVEKGLLRAAARGRTQFCDISWGALLVLMRLLTNVSRDAGVAGVTEEA